MAQALQLQALRSVSSSTSGHRTTVRSMCSYCDRSNFCMIRSTSFTRFSSWELRQRIIIPPARSEIQDQSEPACQDDPPKWWERDLGATLPDIHSAQELEEMISKAEGKLVVVEFFASWCGSCRALYPKLCKLAIENEDVIFAKVNFNENKTLCKSLDVKVLPYFHFYRGTLEKLDSFSCNILKLQKLKDAISKYNVGVNYADTTGNTNVE